MAKLTSEHRLSMIPTSEIDRNPENPRLVFRSEEMESLLLSIDKHGIQVPLTVYRDGSRYKLIDGERRWRCATKLQLRRVPTIVQEKPTELENLVLMYNIHALREQWDYFTIASKLERIISLFFEQHEYHPNEVELSELTGLTRGAIRRCQLLINLPERFKNIILDELEKPKLQQRLTEDFFIEMEKALKSVVRRIPEYGERLDSVRDVLIEKYTGGIITAVTDFRQLSKIATALDNLDIAKGETRKILDAVFDKNVKVGIKEAYEKSVAFGYEERRYYKYSDDLFGFLDEVIGEKRVKDLDDDLIESLRRLYDVLGKLLDV